MKKVRVFTFKNVAIVPLSSNSLCCVILLLSSLMVVFFTKKKKIILSFYVFTINQDIKRKDFSMYANFCTTLVY